MFAYGQTGTGKTHSMIGPPDDPGIIPRLLEEIFFAMDRDRSKQYLPLFFFFNSAIHAVSSTHRRFFQGTSLRFHFLKYTTINSGPCNVFFAALHVCPPHIPYWPYMSTETF
jgi:hypothetical protein